MIDLGEVGKIALSVACLVVLLFIGYAGLAQNSKHHKGKGGSNSNSSNNNKTE